MPWGDASPKTRRKITRQKLAAERKQQDPPKKAVKRKAKPEKPKPPPISQAQLKRQMAPRGSDLYDPKEAADLGRFSMKRKGALGLTDYERAKLKRGETVTRSRDEKYVSALRKRGQPVTVSRVRKKKLLGVDALALDRGEQFDLKTEKPIRFDIEKLRARQAAKRAEVLSPAIKALDQTLRPTRAIASATDELVQGRGVGKAAKAAKRGLLENKGATFSTVLKHAGAPKPVQAVGGFALDVASDPTTYATFGAGSVAKNAARSAAKSATKQAIKKGASKKTADRAGRAAAARTLAGKKTNKGLQIGLRAKVPLTDKEIAVKTSGRATAAISRKTGLSKAATKIRESGPVQATGRELVHDFRPKTRTPAQQATVRAAEREHRAATTSARRLVPREEKALREAVGPDSQRIADVIESGKPLKSLGGKAPVARKVRQMTGEAFDLKRSRGLLEKPLRPADASEAQRYLPHVRARDIESKPKKAARTVGRKVGLTKAVKEQQREFRAPLAVQRKEKPGLFSEDLPKTVAAHRLGARENAALADFWGTVSKTGKRLTPKTAIDDEVEMIYKVEPRGLTALAKEGGSRVDRAKWRAALADKKGKYIVLNKRDYDELLTRMRPGISPTAPGRVFDRVQGAWKTVVTVPMPSYHARNLMGDTLNAFMGDTSANSYRQAARIIGATRPAVARGQKKLDGKLVPGGTYKIAGKSMTGREIIEEAEKHGAIGQGFIAREISDLTGREPGKLARVGQAREDIPRLATYLSARKRGMNPREATEWANKHHFDYGDLTPTERQARRIAPFYTFWARNTRLQATKLVTRPGKAATFGKLLEESAKAAGFDDYEGYAQQLPEYAQRGLPVPVDLGGKIYNVSIAPPATDLNQLTINPEAQAQNIAQRLTQLKLVGEMMANYSVFFRGPIEREDQKLVPAPSIAARLPAAIKKQLGVQEYDDPRRGRIVGWWGKTDYVFRQLPETNLLTQALTPVPGSRQMNRGQAAVGALTGAKLTRFDWQAADEKINQLGRRQHELENRAELMRDRNAKGYWRDPQYKSVLKEIKRLKEQRAELKEKRGDTPRKRTRLRRPALGDGLDEGLSGEGLDG